MNQYDNTIAVVKKAVYYYGLSISGNTVTENLLSHPHYPTLKSVCDFFSKWKIDNYPVQIDKDGLVQAEAPFIAHLNDGNEKLVFVPKLTKDTPVEYFDSPGRRKLLQENEFFEKYSGVSVFINPGEKVVESDYSKKRQVEWLHKALPYLGGLAIVFFIVYSILKLKTFSNITVIFIGLLFTKLVGLSLSFLLVLKDLNINISLADTLCNINKKTDCNSLLRTDAAKVFGWIHWSDVGLIYFFTGLLMMVSIRDSSEFGLMTIIALCALGYVVFSLYYQIGIVKMWCTLCVGVQVVFVAEAVLYITAGWSFDLTGLALLKYMSIGLVITFAFATYKIYANSKKRAYQERLSYLKLKRNPKVFASLLYKGKKNNWDISNEIFTIGKEEAKVAVCAFLSLHCFPCQKAFNELKWLFEQEQVKTHLVFSLRNDDKVFVIQMVRLFKEKKYKGAIKLLETWYNRRSLKHMIYDGNEEKDSNDKVFKSLQNTHRELFKTAKTKATPALFVDGYRFPKEYQFSELDYFIDELKAE